MWYNKGYIKNTKIIWYKQFLFCYLLTYAIFHQYVNSIQYLSNFLENIYILYSILQHVFIVI